MRKENKNIWHNAKTSDHQKISFKKIKKKSKRRSKGGLKPPKNRKHLGSDNEIQNFPNKRSTTPRSKTETLSEEVKRYEKENKTKKKCETRNFISSFLGKRRKFNFRHDNIGTLTKKQRKTSA